MSLRLTRHTSAAAFYDCAEPFLEEHEAEHCLMIGFRASLLQQPESAQESYYYATVETVENEDGSDGAVVAAAVRTPPYNLVVSRVADGTAPDEAMRLLAADVYATYGTLPGVVASSTVSRAFVEAWQRATGAHPYLKMSERIYQLDHVSAPTNVSGEMRHATVADHDLLARWVAAFDAEALSGELRDPAAWVDEELAKDAHIGGLCLWVDDGVPVSMVGYTGPTPHGMRIGPVYTPPELRGHGYGSACTAAVSQWLLENGRQFCFLYTDLANPTSNHIYQVIGYNPVVDVEMYGFGEPERGFAAE